MRRARGLRGDVGDDEGDIRPPESQADGGVMQSSGGVLAVGEKPTQRTLRRGGRAAGVPNIEDSAGRVGWLERRQGSNFLRGVVWWAHPPRWCPVRAWLFFTLLPTYLEFQTQKVGGGGCVCVSEYS